MADDFKMPNMAFVELKDSDHTIVMFTFVGFEVRSIFATDTDNLRKQVTSVAISEWRMTQAQADEFGQMAVDLVEKGDPMASVVSADHQKSIADLKTVQAENLQLKSDLAVSRQEAFQLRRAQTAQPAMTHGPVPTPGVKESATAPKEDAKIPAQEPANDQKLAPSSAGQEKDPPAKDPKKTT